jgi:hypothetical protein
MVKDNPCSDSLIGLTKNESEKAEHQEKMKNKGDEEIPVVINFRLQSQLLVFFRKEILKIPIIDGHNRW